LKIIFSVDALLKESIIEVSLDYLSKDLEEEDSDDKSLVLPSSICGLWDAVKKVHSVKEYFNALIQWDDAWLMTVLKRSYFKNYYDDDSNIRYKLEELLSNKKYYNSLIKRMEEFKDIDYKVAMKLSEMKVLERLEHLKEDTRRDIFSEIEIILDSYEKRNIPEQGFILYQLNNLFDTLLIDNNIFDIIVNETVEEIVESSDKIKDAIVVAKPLKTGLKSMPYVFRNDEVRLLNEFSSIKKDLERDRNLFPLFYIYVHNPVYIDYAVLRDNIGSKLANNILFYIEEIIDEIS
jgi:hypothetical protein